MRILLFEVAQVLVAPMVHFSSAINIRREDMKFKKKGMIKHEKPDSNAEISSNKGIQA